MPGSWGTYLSVLTPPMEVYLASLPEEGHHSTQQLIQLGRLGRPEGYASLAVYLASDQH